MRDVVEAIGPIQSQTARSPYVGLAARMPGVTHEAISAAYESFDLVRGSTIRGTVHTCTAEDHPVLDAVTRLGQRALWARTLRLVDTTLEQVWAGIEEYAAPHWRTPGELAAHLAAWISEHDPDAAPKLADVTGRYFAFGHGGLVRRPASGSWSAQGPPLYRSAASLFGDGAATGLDADESMAVAADGRAVVAPKARVALLADPDLAVDVAVMRHIRSHGPSSRQDVAWWSGLGLRLVDAALDRLARRLVADEGPDGRTYHDLRDGPHDDHVAGAARGWSPEEQARVPEKTVSAPADVLPGVRLLPEFDALLCGYEPAARGRFVDPEHHRILWQQANGLLLAPVLLDGRITGYWRLSGTGRTRTLQVRYFPKTRRPTKRNLADPVDALRGTLGIEVREVTVARHSA